MAQTKEPDVHQKKSGNGKAQAEDSSHDIQRLNVLKTYKLYIGGKFPRTESGRYFTTNDPDGKPLANMCQGSRKDFREAVVAARKAVSGWSGSSAYLRGQILYRIAEMLEGRREQFVSELATQGIPKADAQSEVDKAIDRLVYYAGWCDKYQQVFSSVNPVSASYFNFSLCESTGVVGLIAPEESGLLGLVSGIVPIIAGGNSCIVLASSRYPLCAITLAEVLNTSDVPGGVVNILTGFRDELLTYFASHMDVNAVIYYGSETNEIQELQSNSALNVKRIIIREAADLASDTSQSPYHIIDTQEIKTTWHPVGL